MDFFAAEAQTTAQKPQIIPFIAGKHKTPRFIVTNQSSFAFLDQQILERPKIWKRKRMIFGRRIKNNMYSKIHIVSLANESMFFERCLALKIDLKLYGIWGGTIRNVSALHANCCCQRYFFITNCCCFWIGRVSGWFAPAGTIPLLHPSCHRYFDVSSFCLCNHYHHHHHHHHHHQHQIINIAIFHLAIVTLMLFLYFPGS